MTSSKNKSLIEIHPTFLFNLSNHISTIASNTFEEESTQSSSKNISTLKRPETAIIGFILVKKTNQIQKTFNIETSYELAPNQITYKEFITDYQLIKQIEPDLELGGFYLCYRGEDELKNYKNKLDALVDKLKENNDHIPFVEIDELLFVTLNLNHEAKSNLLSKNEYGSEFPLQIYQLQQPIGTEKIYEFEIIFKEEELSLMNIMQCQARMEDGDIAIQDALAQLKRLANVTREILAFISDKNTKDHIKMYRTLDLLCQKLPDIRDQNFDSVKQEIMRSVCSQTYQLNACSDVLQKILAEFQTVKSE